MIEVNNEKEVPTMYQVKKIRLFNGREGGGFNCNLYRGNAKVSEVIEDGSGGEVDFNWTDQELTRVETNGIDYKDEPRVFKDTPEESLFRTYCLGLPKWDCNGKMVHQCMDIAIHALVNNALAAKECKRNGHKDTGRGVCANCETFLPSSDGEHWA
jgi:hypothetical protein